MPYSVEEGKQWTRELLDRIRPRVVVDVGVGAGTYSDRMRTSDTKWIGIEIWEPYVERFRLNEKYDELIIGDVRYVDLPDADVYLCGDVIEHLPRIDALAVLKRVKEHTPHMIVSVPICDWEQGEMEGNPHEAHLHHWDFDEMTMALGSCASYRGREVGVFHWQRQPHDSRS